MYDNNKKVRFTYRLNDDLFQKLNEEANKKSVSVNAVINDILTEYFLFKANNPSVSVWNLINTTTQGIEIVRGCGRDEALNPKIVTKERKQNGKLH